MFAIIALGNKDLRDRHWKLVFQELSYENPSIKFSFNDLINNNVLEHKEFLDELS